MNSVCAVILQYQKSLIPSAIMRMGLLPAPLEVLLIHRLQDDVWLLPGGGFNPATESVDKAIEREVMEQMGLWVRPSNNRGLFQSGELSAKPCVVVGGSLRLTDTYDKVGWFPVENLPGNMMVTHRDLLQFFTVPSKRPALMKSTITRTISKHAFVPESVS